MMKLFGKTLLITTLIATSACVAPMPKPEPRWIDSPIESASSIEGRWINQGGYLRYRIEVTGDRFELIEDSYCPNGDCSQSQKSSNGKQIYGAIRDGKISAFYIHPGRKYKQFLPKMVKCRTREGDYPVGEVTLTPDGNQLLFRIFVPDINPECNSTKIVFYLVRDPNYS